MRHTQGLLYLVLAVIAVSGCNLFETVGGDEAPDSDMGELADTSATNSDMLADLFDPEDQGGLDMESTDMPVDVTVADMGPYCECVDPAATCSEQGCWLEIVCDPDASDNTCPDDYFCNSDGECECSDEATCGLGCRTSEDCPGESFCLEQEGYCIEDKMCFSHETCPDGTRCTYRGTFEIGGQCRRSGAKADGVPCRDASECASGSCIDGVCGTSCRRKIDCDAGQQEECIDDFFSNSPYCSSTQACSCELAEVCDSDACSNPRGCVAQACGSDVCSIFDEECVNDSACEPHEYSYREPGFGTREYCIDPSSMCFSDADCGSSQACVMVGSFQLELYDSPNATDFLRQVNVCARVIQ